MAADLNAVAEDMFKMVEEVQGKKKLKPADLFKAMVEKHGISKKEAKGALRILIDGERVVYTYVNGSWVELPGGDAAARSMES